MSSLIPQPQHYEKLEDSSFRLPEQPSVRLDLPEEDPRLARHLRRVFPQLVLDVRHDAPAWRLRIGKKPLDDADVPDAPHAESWQDQPEGYRLQITSEAAEIRAIGPAGLFYGLQTLLALAETNEERRVEAAFITDWPDTALRVLNYDLRQTYSRPERLIGYLPELARRKVNGLLIEYEDKFPFKHYTDLMHRAHALTDEQLNALLTTAHEYYIEVIPLQQSFGHLEYVLRHEGYMHLRETETSTGELCPSQEASYELVTGLLEEMMDRHPDARFLHLGCDEVYSLCECPVCIGRYDGVKERAFITFLNRLIAYVAERDKTPIFWHDMLDKCPPEELAHLDKRSVVMIWLYNGRNIAAEVRALTAKFRPLGIRVMGAPAVRSFDWAEHQNYPVLANRVDNLEQWAEVAHELDIDCLVATNWTGPFSLGVPYGIFETTWYPMLLHAELSWNRTASTGDFMTRFMEQFHGVSAQILADHLGRYRVEDYYDSIWKVLDEVRKHRQEAELIAVMHDYEVATDRSRAIHKYLYRWELYPGDPAEWRSLLNNYQRNRRDRERVKPRMQALLEHYQVPEMAAHFVLSRFYLHDYLERTIYRELGLHLEQ